MLGRSRRPVGRMKHRNSRAEGLSPLTAEQCTEAFSKCKSWSLFPSTTCDTRKGEGLPHLPLTDGTGKLMPLSTTTSGSLVSKADFCPAEPVLVLATMKMCRTEHRIIKEILGGLCKVAGLNYSSHCITFHSS